MTEIRYKDVPSRFIEIHRRIIDRWLISFADGGEPYVAIVPLEPLPAVSFDKVAIPEVTEYIRLVAERQEWRNGADRWWVITVSAENARSATIMAAWAENHRNTTAEEFRWHPFAEAKK